MSGKTPRTESQIFRGKNTSIKIAKKEQALTGKTRDELLQDLTGVVVLYNKS